MNIQFFVAVGLAALLWSCGGNAGLEEVSSSVAEPLQEATAPTPVSAGPEGSELPTIDAVTGYTDPVCMMQVAQDAPNRHTHEGVTFGFCSGGCKDRFAFSPTEYLAALEE